MSNQVLVYQIGSLGDTIVSIPCYRALRRNFPGAKIHLLEAKLAEGKVMPSDMLVREKLIDGVTNYPHSADRGGIQAKLQLWQSIFKSRPETVAYIGPAERPPSVVARDKKFFRLCGAKNLVGFHGIDYTEYQTRDEDGFLPAMPHQSVLRLQRFAKDGLDIHQDDLNTPLLHPSIEEAERVLDWLSSNRKEPQKKLVALGIMTAKPLTRWPFESFVELGAKLLETGKVELVVTGGPGDIELAHRLTGLWGQGIVAAGAFGVHEMAALLAKSDLYIGLDTGTTHLAAAVEAPIIVIFSDHTQPGEWSPMGKNHEILTQRVSCGGCRGFECKTTGHPCMTGVTPEMAFDAAALKMELAGP